MKIKIITDLEGVAGVMNTTDWIYPGSKYYEIGKELLTKEVNAAIDGFFAAGAERVVVVDGHGAGAINGLMLDARAELQRGNGKYAWAMSVDDDYDAIAWVGQHPKAGTEYGHLCHTQNFDAIDCVVNGISIGEFGQAMFVYQQFGLVPIFASGCAAFAKEAEKLAPGIETVAVKQGLMEGSGDECDFDAYEKRNWAAIHKSPEMARKLIREGAERALRRFKEAPETFKPTKISAPFTRIYTCRGRDGKPGYVNTVTHPESFSAMMNISSR